MFRRLVLIAVLGSIATAAHSLIDCPAHAADARSARVALVNPHSKANPPSGARAFEERLRELGYIEGRNLTLDVLWANNTVDRLPSLVREAIGRQPDVLVTWGGQAALAAKDASSTVPIVAVGIPLGAVARNMARPTGNLTGLSLGYTNIAGKWLELLKETVPQLFTVAVLINPSNPLNVDLAKELELAAPAQRLKLAIIQVREVNGLDTAIAQAHHAGQAMLVLPDAVLNADRPRLTAVTAKYRLPAIYSARAVVDAGGFMSYGPNFSVQWRRAAEYVDRILKGAKPTDLPIEEPTQFEFVVNSKVAKSLGLPIPDSVLLRADEVIR